MACPQCGSTDTKIHGFQNEEKVALYYCNACHFIFKEAKKGEEKRNV